MNSLVRSYRETMAAAGHDDPRSDEDITLWLGRSLRSAGDTETEKAFPDFRDEFLSLNEQEVGRGRGAVTGELTAGFSRGLKSMAALGGYGAGLALDAVGADETAKKVVQATKEWEQGDGSNAPAVATMDDVHDVTSGFKYAMGQAGQVLPSVGEAVIAGLAGMGAGGPAGAITGAVAKGTVKKMVAKKAAELAARGMAKEAAEAMAYKAVGQQLGGIAASALNAWALSSSEIYGETENPALSLGAGAVAAVPDTILPSYFLSKVLKPAASAAEKELVGNFWKRLVVEAGKTMPVEAGTEAFQELVNIAAEKYNAGEPAELTPQDWQRIRESAVGGAIGGGIFAPMTAAAGGRVEDAPAKNPAVEARKKAAIGQAEPQTPEEENEYSRLVAAMQMTPEQRAARIEVLGKLPKRTHAEERELQVLLAESGATTPGPGSSGVAVGDKSANVDAGQTPAPASFTDNRLDNYGKGFRDLDGKTIKVGDVEYNAGETMREAFRQMNLLTLLKACVAKGGA